MWMVKKLICNVAYGIMTDYKITPLCYSICFQVPSRERARSALDAQKQDSHWFSSQGLMISQLLLTYLTAHMSEPFCLTSFSVTAKFSSESQPVPQAATSSQEELKWI